MSLSVDFSGWWFLALALGIAVLAAYTTLDLARRVQTVRRAFAAHWLTGAAVALGTGIASIHVILVHALPLGFPLGYHPGAIASVWLIAIVVSLLGLGLAGGRLITRPRLLAGSGVLALGVVGCQLGAMQTLGLRPGVDWHAQELALAALWAFGFVAAAMWVFFELRLKQQRHPYRWQIAAALLLALGMLQSERTLIASADLADQTFSAFDLLLPSSILVGLATLGAMALLVMMLVASLFEAQMRRSLRRAKSELHRQALNDPLTGLPNRLSFEAALAHAVREADGGQARFALFAISLDGFKPINEMYGHHNGDLLLGEIARRLRARARPHDMVARLGGDEFLLLLTGNPTPEDAASLAATLLDAVGAPFKLNGREVAVSCSIGVAMYPEHGAAPMLIAHAETALRAAKGGGGETSCFFEARMTGNAREQTDLLRDLRRALANDEFELVYQPKIHAPSGQITGAEALLRWHHPQRGSISPVVFIPIAERFGLIGAIGSWVIDEACRQARAWGDQGLRMRLAINISMHQLRRADLAEHIAEALKRRQIEPGRLTCEITESVAMDDPERTMAMFKRLSAVGVNLSIDDFGTGYSSLAYLRKLPAGELKIDRSFVLDLESSGDARAVVDAVIRLAHALGLKVVAEGVETEAQRKILCELHCDQLQGFLFAKPMSAAALLLWAMPAEAGPALLDFRPSLFTDTAT
jgi:diguanylate cyclase (GGDEF)-like protein